MNYSNNINAIPHYVFYDDKCSLCSAEINHYRKLDEYYPLKWIAIHRESKIIDDLGFDKHELLMRLHVLRSDGVVVTGALAFVTIWSSIKRYRFLGNLVCKLKLVPLLNIAYNYFAKWRLHKQVCEI